MQYDVMRQISRFSVSHLSSQIDFQSSHLLISSFTNVVSSELWSLHLLLVDFLLGHHLTSTKVLEVRDGNPDSDSSGLTSLGQYQRC